MSGSGEDGARLRPCDRCGRPAENVMHLTDSAAMEVSGSVSYCDECESEHLRMLMHEVLRAYGVKSREEAESCGHELILSAWEMTGGERDEANTSFRRSTS